MTCFRFHHMERSRLKALEASRVLPQKRQMTWNSSLYVSATLASRADLPAPDEAFIHNAREALMSCK